MPVPARPHLIVVLSPTESSLVVRRFAPIGKSSSSRSPSANGPWQSAQPAVFQIAKPAFTLSLFCASVIVEHPRTETARVTRTERARRANVQFPIALGFTLAISVSDKCCNSRPHGEDRHATELVIVIAPIGFIGVIKQTLLFCNLAFANYARLKIGHDVVNLLGAKLARSRVEVSAASRAPTRTFLK